jgi:hypothetical protein
VDPNEPVTITGAEAAQLTAVITRALSPIAVAQPGGWVRVHLGELAKAPVNGKPVLACQWAKVEVSRVTVQESFLQRATLNFQNLAFDYNQLKAGRAVIVGDPILVPNLVLDHAHIEARVASNKVKNAAVTYENGQMVFNGRASVLMFSIPFRLQGQLALMNNNVGMRIDSFTIKGTTASASRTQDVQTRLNHVIPLDRALTCLGREHLTVKGGQVQIERAGQVLYASNLTPSVRAE